MAAPLTDEMVLKAIGTQFQAEYEEVKRSRLQSWERIYAAASCSQLALRERQSRTKQEWFGSEWTEEFGFCLVTTHRLICCLYRSASTRKRIYYGSYDRGYGSDRIHRKSLIVDPSPLTPEEAASREFVERLLKDTQVTAEDCIFVSNGKQFRLIELIDLKTRAATGRTALLYEDGQRLYSTLQLAVASGGRIPTDTASKHATEDTVSTLERLTALWKTGGLSDEEFRAAKRKILGM